MKSRISLASTAIDSPSPSILNNSILEKDNIKDENIYSEIYRIYKFLTEEFNSQSFAKQIAHKINLVKDVNSENNLSIILKNLQTQIINLELSQYAESVIKVEKSPNGLYRLSCHLGDKRSTIIVSKDEYFRLFRYRDSSNFLFSNDKSQSHSHVVM